MCYVALMKHLYSKKNITLKVNFAVYSVHCTMFSVQSTVYRVQSSLYNVCVTVYSGVQCSAGFSESGGKLNKPGFIVFPKLGSVLQNSIYSSFVL